MKNCKIFDVSVYVIIDPSVCCERAVGDIARMAVKGGASMIQLRNKIDSLAVVKDQAYAIQTVLADSFVPFIINDYVQLASEIGADGVHIGQGDMSAVQAREIIGDDKILGLTAFIRAHFDAIDAEIVDYVGTGPFYSTLTKPDKYILGTNGFTELVKDSSVPVVGIGGITPENAGAVINAGASGVAMMRSVTGVDDPEQATCDFVNSVKEARLVHSQCA